MVVDVKQLAAAVLVIAGARVAAADVTADVAAGAGSEPGTRDGYATASAGFAASLDRAERSLADRAIGLQDDQTGEPTCCVWIYTGLDPDERMGVGARGSGELRVADGVATGVASGEVWARAYGWGVTASADVQPVGDLRDGFWRPGRDVVDWHVTTDVAPMWAVGSVTTQLLVMPIDFTVGHRVAAIGDAWRDGGWDFAMAVTGIRVQRPRSAVNALSVRYGAWGIDEATSAMTLDTEFADGTWRLGDRYALAAHAGVATRFPVQTFGPTPSGEGVGAPDYWLELQRRDGDGRVDASLGAGSWAHLDPAGLAVDAGQLVTASLARRAGALELTGHVEAGRLRRLAVSDDAPPGTAPVGARMWEGRAEVAAAWQLSRRVGVDGDAYVERSDRDDPRWLVASDGRVDTHAGVDLAAHWRFRHH